IGVSGKYHLTLSGSAESGSPAGGSAIAITASSDQTHKGSRLLHTRLGSSSKGHDRAEMSAISSPPSSESSRPSSPPVSRRAADEIDLTDHLEPCHDRHGKITDMHLQFAQARGCVGGRRHERAAPVHYG